MKALDIIKVVANQEWGADKTVLLNLYRSLIRSTLEYGCIVYGSARPSYLKMLNTVHHQGLRLALGAFRTSPVESLYVESSELPLEQRRIKLSLQYITKLKSTPSNPAYNCVFNPQYRQKYLRNTKTISPLGIRMKPHLEDCDIILDQINDDDIYEQNRSTEGCSKLKRSVDMTSSGKNGLNIRSNASPKWDRTRC